MTSPSRCQSVTLSELTTRPPRAPDVAGMGEATVGPWTNMATASAWLGAVTTALDTRSRAKRHQPGGSKARGLMPGCSGLDHELRSDEVVVAELRAIRVAPRDPVHLARV